MFDVFLIVFSFLFGLIIGSFTNVMIYRIPAKQSLSFPPSTCPGCGVRIQWHDNIPVLSWILLGAKCRNCKGKIDVQYPLIELLTGILTVILFLIFGATLELFFMSVILIILIAIAAIDYKTMIIPNGLVIALIVVGALYTGARFLLPGQFLYSMSIWEPIIGFFAASIPLYLIAVITKGGMGGGDIKLMAAAGIFLGWKGILVAMLIGSLAGAIISIILIILKIKKRKDMIPFGPFLCVGIFTAALAAPEIILWYSGLFTILL